MLNNITPFLPELLIVLWIITLVMRINHRLTKIEKQLASQQKQ